MSAYRGRDMDAMLGAGARDAPSHDEDNLTPSPMCSKVAPVDLIWTSSFTPINRLNISSSPASSDINTGRSKSHGDAADGASKRERNPVVADYLGLGQDIEASEFALRLQDVSKASKKRRRNSGDAPPRRKVKSKTKSASTAKSTQRRISDGMQATKINARPSVSSSKPPKSANTSVDPTTPSGSRKHVVLSDVTMSKLNSFRFQAVEAPVDAPKDTQLQNESVPTNDRTMFSEFDQLPEELGCDVVLTSDVQHDGNVGDDASPHADDSTWYTKLDSTPATPAIDTEANNEQKNSIQFSSDNSNLVHTKARPIASYTDYGDDAFEHVPVYESDHDSFDNLTAEELAELQLVDLQSPSKADNIELTTSTTGNPQASNVPGLIQSTDDFDLTDDGLSDTDLLQLIQSYSDPEESLSHTTSDTASSTANDGNAAMHQGKAPVQDEINLEDWMFLEDEQFFAIDDLEDDLSELTGAHHSGQPIEETRGRTEQSAAGELGDCLIIPTHKHSTSTNPSEHAVTRGIEATSKAARQPIVRPPFPDQVRDRSPIIGLSADMRLCTCFRIGEAFNLGCNAVRSGKTVIIELYARVSSSWREDGIKQHFVFADLFHNHPPFLEGIYELWKDSELWDYDSGRFLHDGASKMCRCIGKMKKDGKRWALTILNIWEATWDDIEHVQGIICA